MRDEEWSARASLIGAIGFALALALLAVLEATHQRADPMLADNERVVKLMLSVMLAGLLSSVSMVYAILPLTKGNWWPLLWLAGVAAGWVALATFYPIESLLR